MTNNIALNITNTTPESFQSIIIETLKSAHSVGSEVYEAGKSLGKSSIDFLSQQIPDVISGLLRYEFCYHLVWVIAPLLILLTMFLVATKLINNIRNEEDKFGANIIKYIVILSILIGVLSGPNGDGQSGVINNALICLKIKTAPKLFLIDYVNGLVTGKNKHNH